MGDKRIKAFFEGIGLFYGSDFKRVIRDNSFLTLLCDNADKIPKDISFDYLADMALQMCRL